MDDCSLSQGIFIQKPKPKSKSKEKNGVSTSNAISKLDLISLEVFEDPIETAPMRHGLYKAHWDHVLAIISDLETEYHTRLISDVSQFIESSACSIFESEMLTPVGLLQSGLSADENSTLFDSIQSNLKSSITPYLARLCSNKCPNVKTAFQNICRQLIENDPDASRFFDESGVLDLNDSAYCVSGEPINSRYVSINDLQRWYELQCPNYFKIPLIRNSPSWSAARKLLQTPSSSAALTTPVSRNMSKYSPSTPKSAKQTRISKPRKSLNFFNLDESDDRMKEVYKNNVVADSYIKLEKLDVAEMTASSKLTISTPSKINERAKDEVTSSELTSTPVRRSRRETIRVKSSPENLKSPGRRSCRNLPRVNYDESWSEKQEQHTTQTMNMKIAIKRSRRDDCVVNYGNSFLAQEEQLISPIKINLRSTPIKILSKHERTFNGLKGEISNVSPIFPYQGCVTPKRVSIAASALASDKKPNTEKRSCQIPCGSKMTTPRNGLRRSIDLLGEGNVRLPRPIVIIIEDVDYCSPSVIQQLLQLLSCAKMPLILIVGVINCLDNFSRFIPQQCSTTFLYRAFRTIPSTERLNMFIEKILFDPEFPFFLSGPIVKYLSDYFLLHHFSVARLMQAYQICLLEHYRFAKSTFCTSFNRLDVEVLSKISKVQLSETLCAVQSYTTNNKISHKNSKTLSKIENAKEKMEKDLHENLEGWHKSMVEWFAVLNFLFELSIKLPNAPLGHDLREMYINCYNGHLFRELQDGGQSPFDAMLKLMGFMFKQDLESGLNAVLNSLNKYLNDNNDNDLIVKESEVKSFIAKVEEFLKQLYHLEEEQKKIVLQATEQNNKSPSPVKFKKNMTRAELKEILLNTNKKRKGVSVYNNLRTSVVEYLEKIVKKHLKPLTTTPYTEIFVFENLAYLKSNFSPAPRKRIHSALCVSVDFLQCKCCEGSTVDSVHPNLPDTSIVYKLFLEKTTKNINLNELYEAFKSIVETPQPPRKRASLSQKRAETNAEERYLIRFRQSVAELQHMGFMKRCKTKPDEVTRQTWET